MKDEQKIAQAKRMEELIVYLKTTARELAKVTGVHENTLYKICCAHNTISNRTAARICFNIEKTLGIVINRQWLINGGIVSFSGDIIKQTLVADTTFCPGDGLSLNVTMQRIVGMFKMRVTDTIPSDVTGFQFTISPSGRKFNISTMQSTDPAERTHTINSTSTDNNGIAAYNIYVMADDMTNVKYVDIEAKALNPTNDGEVRQFTQVPIKNGYVTTYSGTFFVTFGMDFTFSVDDWNEYGSFTF